MHDKQLRSNPIAEEHLAAAMVCQSNINQFKKNGDGQFFIREWEQKKDRYILKAIEESWGADDMDYPPDWDINCKFIRDTLVESESAHEIKLTRG